MLQMTRVLPYSGRGKFTLTIAGEIIQVGDKSGSENNLEEKVQEKMKTIVLGVKILKQILHEVNSGNKCA